MNYASYGSLLFSLRSRPSLLIMQGHDGHDGHEPDDGRHDADDDANGA